ncbi:NIPSNAP family protein [Falsiroseomonas sp. HW251]|uniref:NIPSNAP family protein n=1 Tax=Falsiroseomonas sp. HW251 TaxID=3390998 RepID=UPI003D30F5D6
MQACELVTLTLRSGNLRNPARLAQALDAIAGFVAASPAGDNLLGSWINEFGPQNRILLLRTYASLDAMLAERLRVLESASPFVPAEMLAGIAFESFRQFPFLPPIAPGAPGPYYEFRTYVLKIGGLAPTIAAWEKGVPPRVKLSPLVTAMHSLDGEPRFIHVWAYRTLADRERLREEAFATGAWPAPGAPGLLSENLRTELWIPTAISKLR